TDRKVRKPSISNSYWAIYYFLIALRAVLDSVEYSLAPSLSDPILQGLVVGSLTLNALALLALALALNHQRRHRSSFAPREAERTSFLSFIHSAPITFYFILS